jgi:hypothetical protein
VGVFASEKTPADPVPIPSSIGFALASGANELAEVVSMAMIVCNPA